MQEAELYAKLLEKINDEDIDNILKILYQYYNAPIMLIDRNYDLLAYYSETEVQDGLWQGIIQYNHVPFEDVKYFAANDLINPQNMQKEPLFWVFSDRWKYNRIITSIYLDNELAGYFVILTSDFDSEIKRITQTVTNFITAYLVKHNYLSVNNSISCEQFLIYILEDKFTSVHELDECCEILHLNRYDNYILLCSIFSEKRNKEQLLKSLQKKYGHNLRLNVFIYYGNLYILAPKNSDENIHGFISGLSKDWLGNPLYFGISNSFQDLYDLKTYKEQAETTAVYASKIMANILFKDIVMNIIAKTISENLEQNIYMHPLLSDLRKYDKLNGTEYYITLKEYINSGCQLKQASYKLKIHRNTMSYRIDVIEKTFGTDLSDVELIAQLYLNFKISEL